MLFQCEVDTARMAGYINVDTLPLHSIALHRFHPYSQWIDIKKAKRKRKVHRRHERQSPERLQKKRNWAHVLRGRRERFAKHGYNGRSPRRGGRRRRGWRAREMKHTNKQSRGRRGPRGRGQRQSRRAHRRVRRERRRRYKERRRQQRLLDRPWLLRVKCRSRLDKGRRRRLRRRTMRRVLRVLSGVRTTP